MKRRTMIGGAALLAVAGAGYEVRRLLTHRYPPTPYDDVLGQLIDRDAAARLGQAAAPALPGFAPMAAATRLRQLLGHHGLTAAAVADAGAARTVEAAGWILPESVALLSVLAFRVQAGGA
jgi:hypothetical protein